MNLLRKSTPTTFHGISVTNEPSIMSIVRDKIHGIFFRGDILGQGARVKTREEKKNTLILADKITGASLEKEELQRVEAY
jgi:hypothetical protein